MHLSAKSRRLSLLRCEVMTRSRAFASTLSLDPLQPELDALETAEPLPELHGYVFCRYDNNRMSVVNEFAVCLRIKIGSRDQDTKLTMPQARY